MFGTSQSRFRKSLEKFFSATDELEDKKLEIIGWKGPKIAMKAIKGQRQKFFEARRVTLPNISAGTIRLRVPLHWRCGGSTLRSE